MKWKNFTTTFRIPVNLCDLVSCEERSENLRDEAALLTGGGLIECYECAATVVNGSRTAVHR